MEVEGFRLTWQETLEGAELTIWRGPTQGPPLQMSLRFVTDGTHRRVLVKMAFPFTTRVVNVSTQPLVISHALAATGGGEDLPEATRHAVVGRWVSDLAGRTGAWHPVVPQAASLVSVVGGAAFPMLGAAYERRAGPLPEIPMWAAPILSQPTARAAAGAAFGARATRPVVAAFASSLNRAAPGEVDGGQQGGRANITALALALMGTSALEPDQLTRVLRVARPGAVPSGEQIFAGQKVLVRLGPARAERVLTEAGDADDGLAMLAQMVRMFAEVGHLIVGRPANRLAELHAQCLEVMPRNPNPRPGPAPPRRQAPRRRLQTPLRQPEAPARPAPVRLAPVPAPPAADVVPPARDPGGLRAFAPPPVTSAPTNPALRFPAEIQALDHADLGDMRLVLPRTTYELTLWGQLLGNCLGSFGPAAAAGFSWLVGVEANGRLAYCLELSPDRSVRQFLASRNRPVPPDHARKVLEHLARHHVIDLTHPANRTWVIPREAAHPPLGRH